MEKALSITGAIIWTALGLAVGGYTLAGLVVIIAGSAVAR